uniref:ATP synthase F0 subunit 8 n=1 Tax=Elateroidea sp. BMNH 1274729 TaxID=1796501 RepID=A0A126TEK2_9COLE|nr:ATP synthase F0 subunit 8 [Elateroidea sp. BMNH 1274729]
MYQMSPLSWTILYLMIISVLIIINLMNFFSIKYMPMQTSMTKKNQTLTWEW